jgi:hypothetical protein
MEKYKQTLKINRKLQIHLQFLLNHSIHISWKCEIHILDKQGSGGSPRKDDCQHPELPQMGIR